MRRHATQMLIGALALTSARNVEAATPRALVERAERIDAALRRDEARLRFRHNIERVIRAWRYAARRADTPKRRRKAEEGHVNAWFLLAHWSGRSDDRRTAERLRRQLDARRAHEAPEEANARAPDPSPAQLAQALKATLREIVEPEAIEVSVAKTGDEPEAAHGPEELPDPPRSMATKVPLRQSTRAATRPREDALVRVRTIVVDAGHGGHDDGAHGSDGLLEKDVNLAIALRVGRALEAEGIEVIYTRTEDTFIPLTKRAAIANEARADLFVSIHANAHHRRHVHGIETYYLDTTSDRYAQRLARRENRLGGRDDPSVEPGVAMGPGERGSLPPGRLGQDLRLILADLAMRRATAESRRLAGFVQRSLVGSLASRYAGVRDLGVKHALFSVLLGARMPAVLVETGFMTHAVEGRRLGRSEYRAAVATAVVSGIVHFVNEREHLAARLAGSTVLAAAGR